MCSQKCARPGSSAGSEKWPTLTSIEAAALSVVSSRMSRQTSLFSRTTTRYSRSSLADFSTPLERWTAFIVPMGASVGWDIGAGG